MKTASVKQILIIQLPAIITLVAIAFVGVFYHVPMASLTRDIAAIADIHPLTGVLSNLGVLLWCMAGSICAFAAMIVRSVEPRKHYLFLLSSAFLLTYLMLDDFFQIHDELAGRYLGVNEKIIYALLGISVFSYFVYFRNIILKTNVIVFLLALIFLALSLMMDAILVPYFLRLGDWEYFIEDGAKWLGIVFWCSYFVETSFQFVGRAIDTCKD